MPLTYQIEIISECALMIRFEDQDNDGGEALSQHIGSVTSSLLFHLEPYLMNVTPSFHCILVEYFPHRIQYDQIATRIHAILPSTQKLSELTTQTIELPVYYSLTTGPDLKIYQGKGMSVQDVIEAHTKQTYSVAAIGFAPGFAFLAGLSPALQLARKSTPRLFVPKGSVAIAENQTAVYPNNSPGGWNVIGNCPVSLYEPNRQPMLSFSIGTKVQFYSIGEEEFLELGGQLYKDWNSAK
ncbi:5-oxoprolinase subunit B family protein [Vibrio marisflavi]|uniref:5-oxoprolinase subunit B n=1 Tax=Vibrio marisflavi CECT 7928 TaxID=634439 RepID=A0ABM9A0I7_9VIBR|nr:carboxyltransferase domain-containing protein [Vibrio marisflavi]CAH0536891.1 5-oxoprolinase subunit B [Vibrio marisflavi CECT 7928]